MFSQAFSSLAATTSEPAGGAAIGQVIGATLGAALAFSLLAWLCAGHRSGKLPYLRTAAERAESFTGLPGWAALPNVISAISLLVALLGMYWDISLHIDVGRDPGPLANPAHYLILAGLFGILAAGMLAIFLPVDERPGPHAVHIVGNWYAPVGGILITACGAFALIGFPLDDMWHRLFGQDVTLWGPTHLMLIGGAAMTLVGQALLLIEGMQERGKAPTSEDLSLAVRIRRVGIMGGLLIGLSTFQGEFDFGVPQFRFIFEPVLLAIAASVALVAARLWIGRGGALLTAAMFVLVRGTIALIVWGVFGESLPHLPIYMAEALLVEGTALVFLSENRPRRPIVFGALSGLLIGTVGFGAEYGWSQFAMPIPWTTDLLPEGVILASIVGVAGGLVGSLAGLAFRGELPSGALTRWAPAGALAAIMAVVGYGLVTTVPDGARAHVTLTDTTPSPDRHVQATVHFDPASLPSDDPGWLTATSWQGGGLVVNQLEQTGPGTYRTTDPVPVSGDWKTLIRLQQGNQILGVPIYLPEDTAIPAPEVPAERNFTRPVTADHEILQREQNGDVPTWLDLVAHLVVLAIALSLLGGLAWGVARIGRKGPRPEQPTKTRRASGTLRPAGAR